MKSKHGLSVDSLNLIKEVLSPFAANIEKVCFFGSRAQGTYRANSDIDMVLYGDLREHDISRLHTLFDESSLPVKVDVSAYELIDYPPLKAHVDASALLLFTGEDLRPSVNTKQPVCKA